MLATYPSLKDKVVLVTGGGSGIGAQIVSAFYRQGAKVVFIDIKTDESNDLVTQLSSSAPYFTTPFFIDCDINFVNQFDDILKKIVDAFSGIDILINNAGNDSRQAFSDITEASWDNSLSVNLKSAFFMTQAVVPYLKQNETSSIINFGSVCWMLKQGGMASYSASKAALVGLTRDLAQDLGQYNIRVNTLVPGWVMTEKQLDHHINSETQAWITQNQCIKTDLLTQDIANMAMFLAADDSKMITAQTMVVDGGLV